MSGSEQPSPLLMAALAALGEGAAPRDIEKYFAAAGAQLKPGLAEGLLESLADLGLVRVARGSGPGRTFVRTSIGQQRLDDCLLGGRTEAARLAELERLRTDLLSTIAHELRTPLTALRTSVSLLQDTHQPDAEQRRTLLETIERNAARMQRLVGDILELARFRSGTVKLQLRRFDACQMAAAAGAAVLPLVEAAGQRLALETRPSRIWVYGDHRRLEQALLNLLSNAQKFSPAGTQLEVRVEREGDEVHWSVSDKGPGIEPADRARLFERFFVGRDDRSGHSTGVGLGLPTTLAIAQAHGGRVDVESLPGRGSTFVLVVPVRGPDQESET